MPRPTSTTNHAKDAQLEQLLWVGGHFKNFQKNGQGWKALCPGHDDSKPSLSINLGNEGGVLVKCLAGCPTKEVLQDAGLQMSDLMPNATPRSRIVEVYDYLDERRELLSQAVRYAPKDFRQRTPKPGGGWEWKLNGCRRVPYRLPELLEADPSELVFAPEGEKDVDRLRALGFVATCNVGGAGKWRPEYNEFLCDRHVAIMPDNDDVGRKHADTVARNLIDVAASVKIVELPGLPEKGDVTDWLDAGGTVGELRQIVEQTPLYKPTTLRNDETPGLNPTGQNAKKHGTNSDSEASRSLVGSVGSVENFPLEAFPIILQRHIKSIAEALPCPPDFPGAMTLAVLATFIGRKHCVEVKPSWTEFPLLWIACVARSGDRKTPAFDKVTAPLRRIQRDLFAKYIQQCKEYDSLSAKKKQETSPPRLKQILTTDTTIEALKDVLAGNQNGIIYPADELSGWVRAMSQYKRGLGDDRQHWLSIWSGVQIVSNRKGAPPVVINDPYVCVTGGIQPDALSVLVNHEHEDGFAARILFAYPDPMPNKDWSDDTVQDSLQYAHLCETLWNMKPSREPVSFSSAAKSLWIEWVNAHRKESPPDSLRPMWSKCEGHCARIALILFLSRQACNETTFKQIDEPSICGAIKLISYFKSHARRVYGCVVDKQDNGRIGNALRWIKRHNGTVTARMANQYGLTKDSEAAKDLFRDLAELGYGTATEEARGSVVFRLNEPTTLRTLQDYETTD